MKKHIQGVNDTSTKRRLETNEEKQKQKENNKNVTPSPSSQNHITGQPDETPRQHEQTSDHTATIET